MKINWKSVWEWTAAGILAVVIFVGLILIPTIYYVSDIIYYAPKIERSK